MNADQLTERETAEAAGVTQERIRELVEHGILEPQHGMFRLRDVTRVRVVGDLQTRGIELRSVAAGVATGDLLLDYLDVITQRSQRSDQTFGQLAEEIGVPFASIENLYVAFGLAHPVPEERVRQDDLPILRAAPVLFGAGVGEGEVLQAARVWGDSARRVAEFQAHQLHTSIEEPFRQQGLRDNQAAVAAMREVSARMGHSGEEMLAWLYRRHSETFTAQHLLEHVETALELAGVEQRPTRDVEAVAFADLSGYTRLTEEAGDQAAARVSLTLAQLVSEIGDRHRGVVVKMLGDGVLFHFPHAQDAVLASLDIVEATRTRGLPPAHVGVEAGPMIYDEGDYFGRTVNIAARVASQARADQVFVGEGLVRSVTPKGFRLVEVGAFDLKGISRRVMIHQVVRDNHR
jgi:adenylate cyclase